MPNEHAPSTRKNCDKNHPDWRHTKTAGTQERNTTALRDKLANESSLVQRTITTSLHQDSLLVPRMRAPECTEKIVTKTTPTGATHKISENTKRKHESSNLHPRLLRKKTRFQKLACAIPAASCVRFIERGVVTKHKQTRGPKVSEIAPCRSNDEMAALKIGPVVSCTGLAVAIDQMVHRICDWVDAISHVDSPHCW